MSDSDAGSPTDKGANGAVNGGKKSPRITPQMLSLPDLSGLSEELRAMFAVSASEWTKSLERSIAASVFEGFADNTLRAIGPLISNTLSRKEYYGKGEPEPSSYSPELRNPADYFAQHERPIDSFDDLHKAILDLTTAVPDLPIVWRGQKNADWGLHSNLFRKLSELQGVEPPSAGPVGPQPFPNEEAMVEAEEKLLAVARSEWRFDGTPALELLAKLQHFGAPTRLLDVTRNPYIAAWFAVERGGDADEKDARLFAISTLPVGANDGGSVVLNETGSTYLPFWHYLRSREDRQRADWGTGSRRRLWIPPAYEQRIVAQNAGFILDGVPMFSSQTNAYFRKPRGSSSTYWTKADLLASTSFYAKVYDPTRAPRANRPNFAPTFSYRIKASAKEEIRRYLEQRFAYTVSTIYPDVAMLGRYLDQSFKQIVTDS